MRVYYRGSGRTLLHKGLAIFLEYRLGALHGADDFIPSIIRRSVDRIMAITNETSNEVRAFYVRKAAAVMQKSCNHIDSLILSRDESSIKHAIKDSDDALLLCLIAGMRDASLVRNVLEHCEDVWQDTYCMGYPIAAAIREKDLATVQVILRNTRSSNKRKVSEMLGQIVDSNRYSLT